MLSAGLCIQVKLQRCLPFKHKVSLNSPDPMGRLHVSLVFGAVVILVCFKFIKTLCCLWFFFNFMSLKSFLMLFAILNHLSSKLVLVIFGLDGNKHKLFDQLFCFFLLLLFSWKFTFQKEPILLKKTVSFYLMNLHNTIFSHM